jgi:hypothetical protein
LRDVDPDEAAQDRRRRERIRANAALLGLPPLTPREFREAARDPVSRAKWRALSARQRAVTIAAFVIGLVPLLAGLILMGSRDGHTGAIILLVWILLFGPVWYLGLLARALFARRLRSRNAPSA